jgi:hypothetical protein
MRRAFRHSDEDEDMRVRVLYDRSGRILAGVQLPDQPADERDRPLPRPVPRRGQYLADLVVPAQFRDKDFFRLCKDLKVKGRDKGAELVAPGRPTRGKAARRS